MIEYLKSFAYTLTGLIATVGIVVFIIMTMDALHRISPYADVAACAVLMLLLITSLVHIIRTGN